MRRLLQFTVALCVFGMVLLLILLTQGSAEQFPTEEPDEKFRIVIGFLVFLLAAAVGVLLMVLKRLKNQALSQK